jgi:MoaA/NifB/PqqE/SkfB family radical SAM enzyme
MNSESIWTSTGIKLLQHPGVISRILAQRMAMPISIQIAPTSRCQLNCVFCSNANREKHEDLNPRLIVNTLLTLNRLGLKAVEWTGGGDPTMYEHISSVIAAADLLDLDQGFITNGVSLKTLSQKTLSRLKWIRISMNSLDYVPDIEIPKFHGALGFSYVMNEHTTQEVLARIDKYVKKYSPKYVRIVPNCQATELEQEENNENLSRTVSEWGKPYFYQAKTFSRPARCWWGYLKPFLLHDGYVYPCSSVVLNENSGKTFHKTYRWIAAKEISLLYSKNMFPFPTENCSHCVFRAQNDMVDSLLTNTGMENFI